jgi:hypothetical protein
MENRTNVQILFVIANGVRWKTWISDIQSPATFYSIMRLINFVRLFWFKAPSCIHPHFYLRSFPFHPTTDSCDTLLNPKEVRFSLLCTVTLTSLLILWRMLCQTKLLYIIVCIRTSGHFFSEIQIPLLIQKYLSFRTNLKNNCLWFIHIKVIKSTTIGNQYYWICSSRIVIHNTNVRENLKTS